MAWHLLDKFSFVEAIGAIASWLAFCSRWLTSFCHEYLLVTFCRIFSRLGGASRNASPFKRSF